ncbi:MAG: nitrate reductase molybdenum cofactor assembly chaperone [Hyphomicrobiaceae bacterium]|nr:nitrate reductase molybdenum cofactor assembly chaperone [Hyphomicrobiaceae bacterium]
MKKTLKVLSAVLSYPTAELQAAVPEIRAALDQEARLPQKCRDRTDRILDQLATWDLYELQERYILLFDRTRSLSLSLFEHVHGEGRDRGQAMVDLKQLYERHGLELASNELPDYLPLFLEFLSVIPEAEARELLGETAHILEAIRQRLKKRKAPYSSVFSSLQALSRSAPASEILDAMLAAPDDDPDDLEALDAAWVDEEVKFGPGAATECGTDDIAARIRAARRPAAGVEQNTGRGKRPVVTYTTRT